MPYQVMCSLRIYLRRGDLAEHAGRWWRRVFRKPFATHLVQEALRSGISHASLTYGNMGFARGSKVIASDVSEIPFDTLPVCVELVAPRPLLDQFVRDRGQQLRNATLVMHEGVHLRPLVDGPAETAESDRVEYVRIGASPESSGTLVEQVRSVLDEPSTGEG
jgi:PII-like signaling protein